MYCKHCGKQIADDSKFCPGCGGAQGGHMVETQGKANNSHDNLDTRATVLYLHDVLELESAAKHLRDTLNDVKHDIKITAKWGNGDDIDRPPKRLYKPIPPTCPEKRPVSIGRGFQKAFTNLLPLTIISIILSVIVSTTCCNEYSFFLVVPIIIVAIALFSWAIALAEEQTRYSEEYKIYEEDMKVYNEDACKYNESIEIDQNNQVIYNNFRHSRAKEAEQKLAPLQIQRSKLEQDLKQLNTLLNEAYSVNIIPQKYRSLYPVYFLHEYMSTSNQSFENALLHCQLDKLESQLGKIIKSNYMIILQNAVQIAQNKKMIDNQKSILINQEISIENQRRAEEQRETIINQNDELLRAAQENAQSIEEANKYARISAINSETTAFFATYDHLK